MENTTREDRLEVAMVWDQLTKLPAWKLMQQYYSLQLQTFANEILLKDDDIKNYDRARWELSGIRKLFAMIQTEVDYLKDESRKTGTGAE